jgi:hypothetical protein
MCGISATLRPILALRCYAQPVPWGDSKHEQGHLPVETAAEFLRRRVGNARVEDLEQFIAAAPDVPPLPGDEITP